MLKKYNKIFISLILVINLVACNETITYDFIQKEDNIVKIEIVRVEEPKEDSGLEPDQVQQEAIVKKELSETERVSLIEDIKAIECHKIKGDPGYMYSGIVGFKISYSNGDYEIINDQAVATYIDKRYKRTSYNAFDPEQFEDILYKYSEDANDD